MRSKLDRTVAAMASAKQALEGQAREAWLAGRLLDIQGSTTSIQQMLMTIASRDRPVFSPAVLQMLGLQTYEARMAGVLVKSHEIQPRLEASIAAALAGLQDRRSRLEFASATLRWFYLALFLIGTALTIASKGSEASKAAGPPRVG